MTLDRGATAKIRQQALVEVQALRQAEQHTESLALIEALLKELPWHPDLAAHWSTALRKTAQFEKALQVANDAIDRAPTPWLYELKASNLGSLGDYDSAFAFLDSLPEALRTHIERSRANLFRQKASTEIKALRQAGQYRKSLALIESVLEKLPWHPDLAAHWSESLRQAGHLQKALQVANDAINRDPTPWLYQLKASNLSSTGNYDMALACLDSAPKAFQAYFEQSRINIRQKLGIKKSLQLREAGAFDEALSFIRKSCTQYSSWTFRLEEARCLQTLGKEDELERLLSSWQHLEGLPKAYYQIAAEHAQRQFNFHRVIELSKAAIKLFSDILQIYQPYLISAIQLKNTELTLNIINVLSSKYGNNARAQRILSVAYLHMGEHQQALKHIQRSVELEPTNTANCFQYVDQLLLLGESEKALVFLDSCSERLQKDEMFLLARTKVYWSQGAYDQAVDVIRSAYVYDNLKPNTVVAAIDYLLQLGHIKDAKIILKKMGRNNEDRELKYALALAKIHVTERDLLSAIATLELQVSQQKTHEGLLKKLAQLKLAIGDIKAADYYYKATLALRLQQNKVGAEKHTPSMLGQQINEFKLLSNDNNPLIDVASPPIGMQLDNAYNDSLLAITVIRKMYELDRFPSNMPRESTKHPRKIPLKIFQYWNSPSPPEQIQQLMETCRTINPDCEYTRFDDSSALQYLKEKGLFQSARAFQMAPSPATKADILRLVLLWCEGGIYLDADDLCCKPFSQHIDPEAEIYLYVEADIYSLGNNFMASKPKSKMIGAALKQATDSVLSVASESTWFSTGPALITRCFVSHYVTPELTLKDGAVILLTPGLRRFLAHHQQLKYKQTDQHWVKAFSDKKWSTTAKILNPT